MSPTDELTMVLVTRQDLQLSKGKLAAQCAHAAADCVLSAKRSNPRALDQYKIVLIWLLEELSK